MKFQKDRFLTLLLKMGDFICELNLTHINNLLLIIIFVRSVFNLIEELTSEGYSLTFISKIVCGAISTAICILWLYPMLDAVVNLLFCEFESIVIFGMLSCDTFRIFRYETFPGRLIAKICQRVLERQLRNFLSSRSEIGTQVDQHLEPAPAGQGQIDRHVLNPQTFFIVTEETSVFGGASAFGAAFGGGSFSAGGVSVSQSGFGAFQQQTTPQKTGGFGSAPSFGGSSAFGTPPAFGGSHSFGSGGGFVAVFGSQQSAQTANFSNFASVNAPTFGSLASQSQPAFGNPQQVFGQQATSPFRSAPVFGAGSSSFGGSTGFGGAAASSPPGNTSAFTQWMNYELLVSFLRRILQSVFLELH